MNTWAYQPNPYAAPQPMAQQSWHPPAPATVAGPNASTVLYTPNQMVLATFLGSPLAGTVLLAINEQRLGRPKAVLPTIAFGILATAMLITIGAFVPQSFIVSVIGIACVRGVAQSRQAEAITRHQGWGGRIASTWAAVGIAMLSVLVFVYGIVAYAIVATALE